MAKEDPVQVDPQEVLRMLDEARSRLRTAIWALHGMHQDMNALTADDISDVEQMLSDALDGMLNPAYDAIAQMFGVTEEGGTVTTH
ncbi:MAG: hypothetical protein KatS3mg076_3087 [Candidatus Binatia bacterium]|nr:MAG: hypothetical protein KatS3mg076_3087 [Candidatus Binatia bacterium]